MGSYADVVSQCPAGSYCPASGTASVPCPAGTYQPLLGQTLATKCVPCPTNTYCPATASASFTACPPGFKCPTHSLTEPTPCPAGTYQPLRNQSTCVSCPVGFKCDTDGMAAPTTCGSGFYQASTGQSVCASCPAGKYCDGSNVSVPLSCVAGTFRAATGGTSSYDCQTCVLGTYDASTLSRTTNCPLCTPGSYCVSPVLKQACPPNTNSVAGTSSQLGCRCLAGFVCSYTKRITAVVTLNATSVADFNNNVNNVRTNFLHSLSLAAGVPISKITIVLVKDHVSTGSRRLFSAEGLIDVFAHMEDAKHLASLRRHIHRDLSLVQHEWTPAHKVIVDLA